MRTLLLPTHVNRLSKHSNRWIVRVPRGKEEDSVENYLDYVGNDPFWFDGGNDGNIDPPIFVEHGDGRRTQFYLPHDSVFAPSLVVFVNGLIESSWELQECSGLLTFHVPPPWRSKITAKYHCRFKCVGFRRDNGTIEIREVGPFRSDRPGRRANSAGARRIIADFLNLKTASEIDQDSPLYWLLYESKNPGEIKLLQNSLQSVLEPIIAPKPIHDPRSSRHLRFLVNRDVLANCPETELRRSLERMIQRALVDGKFQTLRTCNSCNKVFIAKHGRARVCSDLCAKGRDNERHKLRQQRYNQKKQLEKIATQRLRAKNTEIQVFERFMQKTLAPYKEQKEIWSIAKRVPDGWKTIAEWQKRVKSGVTYEDVWNSLSSNVRKLLLEMFAEWLDHNRNRTSKL